MDLTFVYWICYKFCIFKALNLTVMKSKFPIKQRGVMKIAIILFFVMAAACSSFTQNKTMKQETIQAKKDSVFTIRLLASIGEGYSWRIKSQSDSTCVKFIKTNQIPGSQDKDGGLETQVFYFTGAKTGTYQLQFVYEKPWLKEKSPKLQYISFSIIIN